MKPKRLSITIIVAFIGVWLTDYLIHGVWLQADYKETMSLWRPEAEMQSHMGWLMLGQAFFTVTFVLIWAYGFPSTACPRGASLYGACMGLFSQAETLILYAVQPFPASLAIKWFVSGIIQGVLIGLLCWAVYRPKMEVTSAAGAGPAPAPTA